MTVAKLQGRQARSRFVAAGAQACIGLPRDERVKLVFRVKIALDNADGLFKPGMPAEVRLEPAEPAR